MPSEVIVTERASRELSALLWRTTRWACQTMGEREGRAYARRLGAAFKAAREDVAVRPLWYPFVNDDALRKLGYRRFLVEHALACVFRVQGKRVVIVHVFDPRSDYLSELVGDVD